MKWLLDSVILIDHFNGVELASRFTAAEADLAASLRRSEGWRLPDALQAAVAKLNRLGLVTRDAKDFPPERYDFVKLPYAIGAFK